MNDGSLSQSDPDPSPRAWLDCWLHEATAGLCESAREEIEAEVTEHWLASYDALLAAHEASEAARLATNALGDSRRARKMYRKIYLTERDETRLARVEPPSLGALISYWFIFAPMSLLMVHLFSPLLGFDWSEKFTIGYIFLCVLLEPTLLYLFPAHPTIRLSSNAIGLLLLTVLIIISANYNASTSQPPATAPGVLIGYRIFGLFILVSIALAFSSPTIALIMKLRRQARKRNTEGNPKGLRRRPVARFTGSALGASAYRGFPLVTRGYSLSPAVAG